LKVETLSADLSTGKAMKAEAAAQEGKVEGSTFIIKIPTI
jgi:hypothetical protein